MHLAAPKCNGLYKYLVWDVYKLSQFRHQAFGIIEIRFLICRFGCLVKPSSS